MKTVLVKCASHRARGKLYALVGPDREELCSVRRSTYKGVVRIPRRYEAKAKAITGVSGYRDGDDLFRCWGTSRMGEA